ncbi:DMT family transporter [Candidatus Villigracilis saccharophilus]|uniref:DMT family transporter n=1 Tax=Candidatus Villigracilis saccharophilus TaxID=3140684 RepID=UPI003134DF81|nr:DMT family transporter [Anaerolineales bacterium]
MKTKHWIIFITLGIIWSSSFLWIKIAIEEMGPMTLVAYRVLFGLLFGIAVILIQREKMPRTLKAWTPLLVLGLTNVAIPFFLISWGEKTIDSGVASILDATVPLFTIVVAHFLLHDDKMTVQKVVGLLIGFAGVVVLMSKDIGASTGSILGQGAVILASAFYAGSSIYARKFTEDTPGIFRSMGPLVSATAVMWLASFFFEAPVKVPDQSIIWIALLWLGILGSGVAFVMVFYLIHEIGPTRTTMVTYLFPLGGVTLGVIFLHETLTWEIVVGAVLILASLVVANWSSKES